VKIFLEDLIVPFRGFWSLAFTRFKGQKLSHASFVDKLATTSCVSDTFVVILLVVSQAIFMYSSYSLFISCFA